MTHSWRFCLPPAREPWRKLAFAVVVTFILGAGSKALALDNTNSPWPNLTRETRPWTYWWWMGSAVDKTNLTRELTRYRDAGLGGVHIIPIYGAKGAESNYIEYLSPKWMEMLRHTVSEGQRLHLGVDMTLGTGWCFGGPNVSDVDANASVVIKTYDSADGLKVDRNVQALMGFGPAGATNLMDKIQPDGRVNWTAPERSWRVYEVAQKPSGQKVKRPAPGGEGHMLNLLYPDAMGRFLERFDRALAIYGGPKPRAVYHDSYEYRSDWAPDFLDQFARRRGYRLEQELPAFCGAGDPDRVARVKCDYRETVSDLIADESIPKWVEWSHLHGFKTRNEAHGSPGNWLDLYAAADIPETEMFYKDRNCLISKFASSAAHVAGRKLVGAETGTWLAEHFTETLGDLKYLFDDMFLSGVNHVFYHGTCYSPDETGWPGWVFYASTEMNPRNAIWHDVKALNDYAARCQSVFQSCQPDNDVLLYWPIYDTWQESDGRMRQLTIHARDWFENRAVGRLAEALWTNGYGFDYVSDRQLATATAAGHSVRLPGASYNVVMVPACQYMPLATMEKLLQLADAGATVVFEGHLPQDVPGLGDLEHRRSAFKARVQSLDSQGGRLDPLPDSLKAELWRGRLSAPISAKPGPATNASITTLGQGRVIVGEGLAALGITGVQREPMVDHKGLFYVRLKGDQDHYYFIANRHGAPIDGWLPIGVGIKSAVLMDPMTDRTGIAAVRPSQKQIYLQLLPGESIIVRTAERENVEPPWDYRKTTGPAIPLAGKWRVEFVQGGPELPPPFEAPVPGSWAALGGEKAQRFAGSARYSVRFDAPEGIGQGEWSLELGKVIQSARVRLNGQDLGTLLTPPFRVAVNHLKPHDNLLEVEVTSTSANRIRYMDQAGLTWKTFNDIDIVNLDYKPFDAANWPLADEGLLGPVTLTPVSVLRPE